MRKEYVSPLFEEIVLMTEDVLTESEIAVDDNKNSGNDYPDSSYQATESDFIF